MRPAAVADADNEARTTTAATTIIPPNGLGILFIPRKVFRVQVHESNTLILEPGLIEFPLPASCGQPRRGKVFQSRIFRIVCIIGIETKLSITVTYEPMSTIRSIVHKIRKFLVLAVCITSTIRFGFI